MFGYVRPLVGQMLVSENEFFRSLYCGLCRALGRHTGCASTLTLSYDFVFLTAFRAALTGVHFTHGCHRCAVHPIKKRVMADDNEVFAYAAEAAAILNAAKLRDDIADESGAKRLRARLLSPAARRIEKRATHVEGLADAISAHLYTILSEIQQELKPDTLTVSDEMAVVAAVGRRMAFQPGVSGKLFAALGMAGINIRMINQGPDELNIIFGVDNKDFAKAIRVLYDSFAKQA